MSYLCNVDRVIPTLMVMRIHLDRVDGVTYWSAVHPGMSVPARAVGWQYAALHCTRLEIAVAVHGPRRSSHVRCRNWGSDNSWSIYRWLARVEKGLMLHNCCLRESSWYRLNGMGLGFDYNCFLLLKLLVGCLICVWFWFNFIILILYYLIFIIIQVYIRIICCYRSVLL